MRARELARLAAAMLLGAALAFPLARMLDGDPAPAAPLKARPAAERRAVLSPDVRGDPYVQDQLRRQVEALEAHCRRTGELCAEARGARARQQELAARR